MNIFQTIKSCVDAQAEREKPLVLPAGRTEAEALAVARKWRALIWEGSAGKGLDEHGRIDLLERTCIQMLGDRESGERLATRAIWSPS